MKKILKGLALATLVATSATAATDQTFLQVRPQGVNLAMESTTWRDLLLTKKEDAFGAHFQVAPFYMDSSDSSDIGKYFGIDGKDKFKLANADVAGMNSDIRYMLRNVDNYNVDVEYSPNQTAYGARIDYFQDLDKVLKGLYFKVALPIVYVDNDVKLNVTTDKDVIQKTNVEDYFKGAFLGTDDNEQEALHFAKIDGGQNTTDVADIDVALGYKVINKDNAKLAIEIGLTIPTSNDADGVWVFEPISGNNNHWGLGGDLDFWGKVWEDEDQYVRIDAALNWRYLFKSSETRTLRLKNETAIFNTPAAPLNPGGNYHYTQYRLVGQGDNDQAPDTTPTHVKPLANISTLNIDVTPGSQLDGIVGLAYCNGGFSVELGYNLFWKEEEDVDKKAELSSDYKLLDVNGTILEGVPALVYENLDLASAETPSYFTNKIYGGFGYIFKEWDTPLMLGLGGQYEFAGNNEEIENWGIWGKLGIKF